MKQIASRANYGEVYPISKADWVNEVNEISQVRHCWVVAYLWDTSVNDCKLMDMLVREVAQRHRDVKFVSISADTCIENWPKRYDFHVCMNALRLKISHTLAGYLLYSCMLMVSCVIRYMA